MKTNEHYTQIKESVAEVMAKQGWTRVDDLSFRATAAVATKQYDTAVGKKQAIAYLTSWENDIEQLTVDYQSEGRNIAQCRSYNIPADHSAEDIKSGVTRFCNGINHVVEKSYAGRLNRPSEYDH